MRHMHLHLKVYHLVREADKKQKIVMYLLANGVSQEEDNRL